MFIKIHNVLINAKNILDIKLSRNDSIIVNYSITGASFDEFIFDTKEEANKVLNELYEQLRELK